MKVLTHPFRIDPNGAVVTVVQGSDAQARQITEAVVSTRLSERVLAPDFGTSDPTSRGVDTDEVWTAVELCEPDLLVTDVAVTTLADGTQDVLVSAVWRED